MSDVAQTTAGLQEACLLPGSASQSGGNLNFQERASPGPLRGMHLILQSCAGGTAQCQWARALYASGPAKPS